MGKNTQNKDTKVTDVTLSNKKENFLKALKANSGNIAESCRSINISRQTYYRWKQDKTFAEACMNVEEGLLDFAESQLHKQIRDGNVTATIFYLKTKGKKRGYVERQELDLNSGDNPFNVSVNINGVEH